MKSNRIRIALAALGALVFALSSVSPASAFIRLARQGTTGVVQAHWLDSALPVVSVINPTNADIPSATALSVVQASAQTWQDINTSYFTVNPVEYTGAPGQIPPALNAGDGQNSMFFDTAGVNFAVGSGVIAFVRSTIDATDGHTLDADLVFNDHEFFASTSSPSLTPAPAGQQSVDLQSVVTHEYGHYFGLDHTSVQDATMIPFIIGDTRQRTLELDDRAGNSTIYPESASRPGGLSPGAVDFAATSGTVSGTVVSGYDGSATFGAHVEAILLSDPSPANTISAISGELTLRSGQGDYTIHGLPPGDYAIRIVPLDGIHTIASDANVGGPYNGLDINFEPEFWNGAGESGNGFTDQANDFSTVSVAAGADTPGIGFITNTFPGQVEIAQYGQFENIVTFRNTGFLAHRFDPPFAPPYTISKITFPSFTFNAQFGGPPFPAIFPSVRLCELNTATGLPNLSAPLFQITNFAGSPNGVNEVPINLTINDPDKVLFWAIQFPVAGLPGFPTNFPFLRMDFTQLERGLFANDYSIALNGTGGTLIDRNIAVSMTCELSSPDQTPIVPIANLGANRRLTKFDFTFSNPPDVRLDGFALPGNSLDHANLVHRLPTGVLETFASAGAGSGKFSVRTDTIPSFPGGVQFWFAQAVDKAGHKSLTSNTDITGLNEDADEPNGRASATEAKLLPLPAVNRPETYSPAGDQDNFLINATPGQIIQASAVATGQDGNNNTDLVMFVLDSNGDVLAFDDDSNGNLNPKLSFTVPPPAGNGKSTAARKFYILVTDFPGSAVSPAGVPQVRVPQTYTLSASVLPPAALAGRMGTIVGEDGFAFRNSGPNPANPQAKLVYVLPQSAGTQYGVKLRIYDVTGRLVRSLVDGNQAAGPHTAVWNGTDDAGRGVASGHYYARLDAGAFSQKVGITILK